MNTNFENLRKRIIARLTSPPEILCSLTSHWLFLAILVVIGSAFMIAKVQTDPVMYEGKATLVLNSNDAMVVGQGKRAPPGRPDDANLFFRLRMDVLLSDTVLRNLVNKLKAPAVLAQEENREKEGYGPLRKFVNDTKERIQGFMDYLEHPNILDAGVENEVQKAVASLRRRSVVIPSPRTSTVELRVYGNDRTDIAKELDTWIEVYIRRLVDMAEEGREIFIDSRTEFWSQKEDEARLVLERFKNENPAVSASAINLLFLELGGYQARLQELRRELDSGGISLPPIVDAGRPKDPGMAALQAQRNDLQRRIIDQTATYGELSDPVKSLKRQLELLDAQLLGADAGLVTDPVAKRNQLEEQVRLVHVNIAKLTQDHTKMAEKLDEMKSLESTFRRAEDTRQNYQLLALEEGDRGDARRTIQVQIADKPTVSWRPFNTYPHRQVLFGALGALGMGVALVLMREALSGRVRHKNDILTEFGIAVVGVFPRK